MKILLIEDNLTIAKQILEFLENFDYQADYAGDGELGIRLAFDNIYDVILLDLNLPDIDGLQVCKQIKESAKTVPPILMLTARDRIEDKASGFSQGADDYLTKPFDLRELKWRCEALARRQSLHQSVCMQLGDLTLDTNNNSASRQGVPIKLTAIGFSILNLLVQAHPNPVSREFLTHSLWGDSPPDSDALKSHIYSLRRSLDKPFDKAILKTVMNVGFKLDIS